MSGLDSIPIVVAGEIEGRLRTENLGPLLRQLEQALEDLLATGDSTVIDLGAMPFSRQDEEDLRAQLGRGEVSATLNAFGPTLIEETAVPGVWLIEHRDADDRRLTLQLEVARIPSILVTPEEDIGDGLAALKAANTPPDGAL
ncbi:MAG: hydrogenase expression/formation protein [Gammaproteobacteria bacterium]|nr:hydrogenase expression/formation protein [Gammaproteobacteria bacterium]MCP5316438.1 hydrogenase expression/formation protein [Chromatiaceae bacterium]MCB1818722.1 hydrogenase expression/formation protein [Gammaproteobacteria bacterium]MCP5429395.1 hydrogenase expression/formation protein [Chromatiaceae bacterium]MCP5434254.1 hydrogenase expression/formation protein [Chromatiaceae bacterium]